MSLQFRLYGNGAGKFIDYESRSRADNRNEAFLSRFLNTQKHNFKTITESITSEGRENREAFGGLLCVSVRVYFALIAALRCGGGTLKQPTTTYDGMCRSSSQR